MIRALSFQLFANLFLDPAYSFYMHLFTSPAEPYWGKRTSDQWAIRRSDVKLFYEFGPVLRAIIWSVMVASSFGYIETETLLLTGLVIYVVNRASVIIMIVDSSRINCMSSTKYAFRPFVRETAKQSHLWYELNDFNDIINIISWGKL